MLMGLLDRDPLFERETIDDPAVKERLLATFDLYELAEGIMRQNLLRRYPLASEEEIERRLLAWLRKESGP